MVSALSMVIWPYVYKYFSQSCEKLTNAIKHSDISGTSELTLNGMELLYNLHHCSQALVHHTYMSFLTFAFPPLSVCCCLIERWTNFCWGRRRVSQEWQKHFSFGQANRLSVKPSMLNAKHVLVKGVWGRPW